MDKIRIYIALLFCLTLSFIHPVHARNNIGSNRYNTQYSYDSMGHITSLRRNGLLDEGSYGLILPSVIEFAGGKTIKYTYSADGHKLRAVYTTVTPATTKQIDYCGNLIFENGQLQQINVDGGYTTYIGSSWAYHFYVKDHLGNNRIVIHPSSLHQQPQVNNYYPYGGLMANSTNHNQQRYKYNGKELDRMHGLDWYDYGARWMDAAIGRWHGIDPLCEKYYDVSPYVYCNGNPINQFDPDGRAIETVWDIGNVVYDVGAAIYNHVKGDHETAKSHWVDAGLDAVASLAPFIPAGSTKLFRGGGNAVKAFQSNIKTGKK